MKIGKRKDEHIDVCLKGDARASHNYWDDVVLRHVALPEADLDRIGLRTEFLGTKLSAPLVVTAMTGGTPKAGRINATIAEACAELGIGMGVGSQRIALEHSSTASTFSVVKGKGVPLVIANLGLPQFSDRTKRPYGPREAERAMSMVGAHFLAVHLNMAQEVVQPGGDAHCSGALKRLESLAADLPLIAKEVGCGIDARSGMVLARAGFRALDVSGLSGTSFPAVEWMRSGPKPHSSTLGGLMCDWGIPAPASLSENGRAGIPLIASGGIRDGIDAARALSLGASLVGIAGAALPYAVKGKKHLVGYLEGVTEQLRAAIFLSGGKSAREPSASRPIIMPPLRYWLE